ncbi:MAG: hypothetical protein JXA51_04320 [Dehalococcoidales bacterium]|nr:hypothetical protein [Dehalococcoidales bacterium]
MEEEDIHIHKIWRGVLIVFGLTLVVLGVALGDAFNLFIMVAMGMALVLGGCGLWVRDKNRNSAHILWGLLPPVGFIAIMMLKDRSGELEKEDEIENE